MSTLAEIEAATAALSAEEKEALLVFLANRLRAERGVRSEPRLFTTEQIAAWVAEDEADMRQFLKGA